MPTDTPPTTPEDDLAALTPAALDAWLRAHLSRQAVAALLITHDHADQAHAVLDALRSYGEIRLLTPAPDHPHTLLTTLAPYDPDLLLLWRDDPTADAWPRSILAALDDLGLRDRFTVLLLGPGADRATAHRLGCEDGLPPDAPIALLAARIAHAALANEDYHRRGSSPPCYL